MKAWKIPVSWTVTAVAEIEADTLAEAIDIAKYNEDDTSISFGFFNLNNDTDVTDGDIHIYDAPMETIKIVGK